MATTYTLKRKTFTGNPQDPNNPNQQQMSGGSAWGTVGKIGAGLATVGGAFYGARKGLFGSGAAMSTNRMWGSLGKTLGSDSMKLSAAQGYGKAVGNRTAANRLNVLTNGGKVEATEAMKKEAEAFGKARGEKAGNMFLDGLLKETPKPAAT